MEAIKIHLTNGNTFEIIGKHRPDLEKPNWHYYEDNEDGLYHFRKEHMVAVYSRPIKKEK